MKYTRRQYSELGGLLASAMVCDFAVNTRASGMERDVFDSLTGIYLQDPVGFKDKALEACHHAGFTERDAQSMEDWVNTRLFNTDGTMNMNFLWGLCVDSVDDYGNGVPLPEPVTD